MTIKKNSLLSASTGLMFLILFFCLLPEVEASEHPNENRAVAGSATFEGSMALARYAVSADGLEERISEVHILISSDNISMESVDGGVIDLVGNIRAEKILIRQSRDDLVFFTTDRKAVTMNRQELQQMINMLENMRGSNSNGQNRSGDLNIHETEDTQTIQGYTARKWTVNADNRVAEWHIWVTDDISVPWGMLSQQWLLNHTILGSLPAEKWLNDGKLPIKAEHYNGGRLAEVIRFEDISSGNVPESDFRIPADYQQINFQQMLFDRMRNR